MLSSLLHLFLEGLQVVLVRLGNVVSSECPRFGLWPPPEPMFIKLFKVKFVLKYIIFNISTLMYIKILDLCYVFYIVTVGVTGRQG